MLNRVDSDHKANKDGSRSVVEETPMVTFETGEVICDDVVNPSTIDKSVERDENSSDKEEEKEPREGDKVESRRNDEHDSQVEGVTAEETGEAQAARHHEIESHEEVSRTLKN